MCQMIRTIDPSLYQWILDKTAPHDGNAKDHFANFLQRITVGSPDPDWSVVPTCIVDSGDLTTFGDLASLDLGSNYLQTFGAGW